MQQNLPQQEIQKIGLSVHAPSSSNNMLNVTTVVQQIITELREAVPKKDKKKWSLQQWYLTKRNGC
jgi:hypothetical protein